MEGATQRGTSDILRFLARTKVDQVKEKRRWARGAAGDGAGSSSSLSSSLSSSSSSPAAAAAAWALPLPSALTSMSAALASRRFLGRHAGIKILSKSFSNLVKSTEMMQNLRSMRTTAERTASETGARPRMRSRIRMTALRRSKNSSWGEGEGR